MKPEKTVPLYDLNAWLHRSFSFSESDQWVSIYKDAEIEKYQQYHQGYPIESAIIIVHHQHSNILLVNGVFYDLKTLFQQPLLSSETAQLKAVQALNVVDLLEEDRSKIQPELVILPANAAEKATAVLTYKVLVRSLKPFQRKMVYLDAQNGSVLQVLEMFYTDNVTAKGKTSYYGVKSFTSDSLSHNTFILRENRKGVQLGVFDCEHGASFAPTKEFSDADNDWKDLGEDSVIVDVHWAMEVVLDYYKQYHNRNSYDNQGSAIRNNVHFLSQYDNAGWVGDGGMIYGDGYYYKPLVSLDVCGHELTHGVTEKSAGLIYSKESGALNESFSDIFGETVEQRTLPGRVKWLLAEDCVKPNTQIALRSMKNPNYLNQPDTYRGAFWTNESADNYGVHTNSGVQNYWYYLLVEGGSGSNDNGKSFNVQSIGLDKAEQIAYRNLTQYLTPSSNYADAREGAILSAMDLFGLCSNEVKQVVNAWYAVGVGDAYPNAPKPSFSAKETSFCKLPAVAEFQNKSIDFSSQKWFFGDGTSSTEMHPVHEYKKPGQYTVVLEVTGCTSGAAKDSQYRYITVDTNAKCYVMLASAQPDTLPICEGIIKDPGGDKAYSTVATNAYTTLMADDGMAFYIQFDEFDINPYDRLEVYDGASPYSGFLIADGTRKELLHQSFNTSSNQLCLRLVVNDPQSQQQYQGFSAFFSCYGQGTLLADFQPDKRKVKVNEQVMLENHSKGLYYTSDWDFGADADPNVSGQQGPVFVKYETTGFKDIKLEISDWLRTNTKIWTQCIEVVQSTGVEESEQQNTLQLYPNPTSDHVFIRWDRSSLPSNVQLFNALGQSIPCTLTMEGNGQYFLSLSALPPALYLLSISDTQGNSFRQQIIKE